MSLSPDRFVDSDHPDVIAFAEEHAGDMPPRQAAIALFYAVRDGWRYDPWNVSADPEHYRASHVLAREPRTGHCIDKAVLLAAAARALGIPARLHFADVRNHVATEKLEQALGTDLLVYHGYAELWLDGRWLGVTPAFNASLCHKLGVAPLEFDGEHEAIFQEYDRAPEATRRQARAILEQAPSEARAVPGAFMEYVTDHGAYDTLPFDDMLAAWREHYRSAYVKGFDRP